MELKLNAKELATALGASEDLQLKIARKAIAEAGKVLIDPELHEVMITPAIIEALRDDVSFQNEVGRAAAELTRRLGPKSQMELGPKLEKAIYDRKRAVEQEVILRLLEVDRDTINTRVDTWISNLEHHVNRKIDEKLSELDRIIEKQVRAVVAGKLQSKIAAAIEEALK